VRRFTAAFPILLDGYLGKDRKMGDGLLRKIRENRNENRGR